MEYERKNGVRPQHLFVGTDLLVFRSLLQDLQLVQAACQSSLKLKCHGIMSEIKSLVMHTNRLTVGTPHLRGSIRFMHAAHLQDY